MAAVKPLLQRLLPKRCLALSSMRLFLKAARRNARRLSLFVFGFFDEINVKRFFLIMPAFPNSVQNGLDVFPAFRFFRMAFAAKRIFPEQQIFHDVLLDCGYAVMYNYFRFLYIMFNFVSKNCKFYNSGIASTAFRRPSSRTLA